MCRETCSAELKISNVRSFLSGTEVIVGGGIILVEDDRAMVTTTTEIYNFGTGEWRNGKIVDKYEVTA